MRNQIGFVALTACAMGMGTLLGCETEDPGAAAEPSESVSEPLIVGSACTPDPWGVSASSVRAGTNNIANNAIDGNLATRWESEWKDGQSIQVDLGSQMPITTVKLTWQNSCGKDYDIQTSNSASGPWTTVVAVTGNTKSGTANPLTYSLNKKAQFVRMNGKTRCTTYGFSLYELQVNTTTLNCNLDRDGDGVGRPYLFCGSCISGNISSSGDCNDSNATAKPGQTNYFLTAMTFADGSSPSFDWNCDGVLNWKTSSGWLESDGVFNACTDSTGKKTADCSKCIYNFVPVDASDCGMHRCSLGAGEVDILCH